MLLSRFAIGRWMGLYRFWQRWQNDHCFRIGIPGGELLATLACVPGIDHETMKKPPSYDRWLCLFPPGAETASWVDVRHRIDSRFIFNWETVKVKLFLVAYDIDHVLDQNRIVSTLRSFRDFYSGPNRVWIVSTDDSYSASDIVKTLEPHLKEESGLIVFAIEGDIAYASRESSIADWMNARIKSGG